jgi:hypothetical protein
MEWNRKRSPRRSVGGRAVKDALVSVESLEGRALLATSSLAALYGLTSPPVATSTQIAPAHQVARTHHPSGIVSKAPHFYQFYTGPKLAELNAVRATGELSADGSSFTFTGTNQGRISKSPAVYVWGIDRSPNPPASPFTNRPNIKFDAVVVVSVDATLTPTALVKDLDTGITTALPSGSATIQGRTVSVTLPTSLLPSEGLAPSQYRFNYWPEDGGPPVSSSVASFAPENTTAQVG